MLSVDKVEQLAETFHLLGDANRLRLVYVCLDESVSVQDLAERLGLSQSLTSHHLRLLCAERRGKQVFYVAEDVQVRWGRWIWQNRLTRPIIEAAGNWPIAAPTSKGGDLSPAFATAICGIDRLL